MQTLFTPSRPHKGRPTTHQPSGCAFTSTPEFIGGHARTQDERLEALARIKAKTSADFALRDREIKDKGVGRATEEQEKARRLADALLREHAAKIPKKTVTDPLDDMEIVADIDDIDESGRTAPLGYDEDEQEDEDGTGGEVEVSETDGDPAAIDDLISRRESRARADRWGKRPALGFEGGAPLGVSTADICERGQERTKSKPEMTRADEAREFQMIRQSYPLDGYDYKVLCYLCDPSLSKPQIADKLGRDPRAIRYAAKRIREQAAAGKFRTRRGAGATGINMDDRAEVGAWLAKPLPVAKCGRKKKGTTKTPKKIRVPKRLKLAPREPQNVVIRAWGTKPRVRRPRIPDFASPQADFGALFGAEWGIPIMARAA